MSTRHLVLDCSVLLCNVSMSLKEALADVYKTSGIGLQCSPV